MRWSTFLFFLCHYSKQDKKIWPTNLLCRELNNPLLNMLCCCTETLWNHINWIITFFLQLKIEVRSFETKMGQLETDKCHHLEKDWWKNCILLCTCCCIPSYFYNMYRAVQKNSSNIILTNLQWLKEYRLIFWNVACIFTVKTLSLVKFASLQCDFVYWWILWKKTTFVCNFL